MITNTKKHVAERHRQVSEVNSYGRDLKESFNIFHEKIEHGCIFVCGVCQQTNFQNTVLPIQNLHSSILKDLLKDCLTGFISVNDKEYICLLCKSTREHIPKLSLENQC